MKIKLIFVITLLCVLITSFSLVTYADIPSHYGQITDLSGTTWTFNDVISVPAGYGQFTISGVENGNSFQNLYIGYSWTLGSDDFYLTPLAGEISTEGYITISTSRGNVVTFADGADSTNSSLISWVSSNMTQVSSSEPEEETFMFNAGYFKTESAPTYSSVPEASASYSSLNIPSGSKIYFNDDYTGSSIYDIGYRTSVVSDNIYSTTVGYRIADGLSYTEAFTIHMTIGGVSIETANNFYCFYFPEAFEVTELEALFLSGCLEETSQPVQPDEPEAPSPGNVEFHSGYYAQNPSPFYAPLAASDYVYISLPEGSKMYLSVYTDGRSQFEIYDLCYKTYGGDVTYTDLCYREASDSDPVPFMKISLVDDVAEIKLYMYFSRLYLSDVLLLTSEQASLLNGALVLSSQPEDVIIIPSGYYQADSNFDRVRLPSNEIYAIPCSSGSRVYFNNYVNGVYYQDIDSIGYVYDEYVNENDWTIACIYTTSSGMDGTAFVLDCVGGYVTKENYNSFSQFYFASPISGDNQTILFLSSVLEPSTNAPSEPVPDYEGNPFYDIMIMIIEALQAPLFGYWSAWDMFCSIMALFVCAWLLRLLGGVK